MKIGKRQIVLASLVLALGAAVYLNWQFSDNDVLKTNTQNTIGQARFVSNQSDESVSGGKSEGEKAQSGSEGDKSAEEYFSQVRTERQKAQDEAVDMAKELIEKTADDDSLKSEAIASATKIADVYQQQTNIEGLIKAKGYSECVAFIQNGECSIVLKKSEMKDDTNLVIKDIVSGQSGIEAGRIKITGV